MSWWIITFDRIFNLTIFRWQFALEVVNSTKSKEIWSIAHSCSWKTGKWSWELYPIRADQGQGLKINCYFSIDPKLGLLLCFFPSIVVSRVWGKMIKVSKYINSKSRNLFRWNLWKCDFFPSREILHLVLVMSGISWDISLILNSGAVKTLCNTWKYFSREGKIVKKSWRSAKCIR